MIEPSWRYRAVAYITQLELNHGRLKYNVDYTVNIS